MRMRGPKASPAALWVLYFSLLGAKVLYVGVIFAVPYFMKWFLGLFAELGSGTAASYADFRASGLWLGVFSALTVLSCLVAARFAARAADAARGAGRDEGVRVAARTLPVSWILLDSISFYGVVSKALKYSNFWCYGFVAVSTIGTILAGKPLVLLRRPRPADGRNQND